MPPKVTKSRYYLQNAPKSEVVGGTVVSPNLSQLTQNISKTVLSVDSSSPLTVKKKRANFLFFIITINGYILGPPAGQEASGSARPLYWLI